MKIKSRNIILVCLLVVLLSLVLYFLSRPKIIEIRLNPVPFSKLPGWGTGALLTSFSTFQDSCKVFIKQPPEKIVGSEFVELKVKDWLPACTAAFKLPLPHTSEQIRTFFQTWFDAFEFHDGKPVQGLFTGYYMSTLKGSLTKTNQYNVPIYGLPDDLISVNLNLFDPSFKNKKIMGRVNKKHSLIPYYTRAQIDRGAIDGKASVIAWVDNEIDRLFLEIQGSGVIEMSDGTSLYVNYAAQNGAPYTSIAGVLIKQGVMTKDNASMQHIRHYLAEHPSEVRSVMSTNKSFVFFEPLKKNAAYGSQGTELMPGYSLAVDLKWVPIGAPVWLSTVRPSEHSEKKHLFRRLMIAQDTGGAIRGPVRGDIYWGAGKKATSIAGKMKNPGQYWLLLPKHVLDPIPKL
jgi:membrane-bound lytic murein transglycosylase A